MHRGVNRTPLRKGAKRRAKNTTLAIRKCRSWRGLVVQACTAYGLAMMWSRVRLTSAPLSITPVPAGVFVCSPRTRRAIESTSEPLVHSHAGARYDPSSKIDIQRPAVAADGTCAHLTARRGGLRGGHPSVGRCLLRHRPGRRPDRADLRASGRQLVAPPPKDVRLLVDRGAS